MTSTDLNHHTISLARDYARKTFGMDDVQLISDSNNAVYSVGDKWVVKVVTDDEVDLDLWRSVSDMLVGRVPVSRILDVQTVPGTEGIRLVASEALRGQDLAAFVKDQGFAPIKSAFLDMCRGLLDVSAQLEPPRPGFGPYKAGTQMFPSVEAYYVSQVDRFATRLATYAGGEYMDWAALGQRMAERFRDRLGADLPCGVFPIDINLKNFFVDDAGRLHLLNIPIFAFGPLVHGVASVVFQVRGQGAHHGFAKALYPGDPRDLALFEAYNALGVIAFYARKGEQAVRTAPIWGGTRTLFEIQVETAQEAGIL